MVVDSQNYNQKYGPSPKSKAVKISQLTKQWI